MESEPRSPEEIEREIETTRTDIEGTVEELGERLVPRRLVGDAVGYARHSAARGASQAWSRASDTLRDNAIPLALIGSGVAWWFATRSRGDAFERYPRWGDAGYDEYRSMSGEAGERWDTGERAMARGRELGERAREGLQQGARRAQQGLQHGMERAQHGVQYTQQRVRAAADDQPMLLGLAALAIGALVGGSLPSTRREDEMLGETRDQVVQRAAEAGREKVEQVRHATEEAAQQARARGGADPSGQPGTTGEGDGAGGQGPAI